MRIALDAKRAFLNRTGLGNYSRAVIKGLIESDDSDQLYLGTPKLSEQFKLDNRCKLILPESALARTLSSLWRSRWVTKQLSANNIDIYHGLSNELPFGIEKTGIRTVVTIHDLIFLRYPEFYPVVDRKIYNTKVEHACKVADRIITISQQTKDDLISLLNVDSSKIDVIYQTCHERFSKQVNDADRKSVAAKYKLPENFMLSVGTIEKRKNHQQIIKALSELKDSDLSLVIVGRQTSYTSELEELCKSLGVESKVNFLSDVSHEDLPAIYQQAKLFVYTSLYEGFGIPVLEALKSKIPVVTSRGGCLEEVGGSRSLYVDPSNAGELAEAIQCILNDEGLVSEMVEDGKRHAEQFSEENMINGVRESYNRAMKRN